MLDVRSTKTIIHWPSPQDYNEALQNAALAFTDPYLRHGEPELNSLGLPKPNSGAFASVYRMICEDKSRAVRCFLRHAADQELRYQHISAFLHEHPMRHLVNFEYQNQGIRIGSAWFPMLKMDWVEGDSLDIYVGNNLHDKPALQKLIGEFIELCEELSQAGIAHGDLQHGNILVGRRGLQLVDYDGMYVPPLAGLKSNELGHRNYQHPVRSEDLFGPYLDNFSAWVILVSLEVAAADAHLYNRLKPDGDALLFDRNDFVHPENSIRFAELESHQNTHLVRLARALRFQIHQLPSSTKRPDQEPEEQTDLPPLKRIQEGQSWWQGASLQDDKMNNAAELHNDDAMQTKPFYATGAGHGSATTPHLSTSGLSSLSNAKLKSVPRRVRLNWDCGRVSPVLKQLILLAIPHTWVQIAITLAALASVTVFFLGQDTSGTVAKVDRVAHHGKREVYYDKAVEVRYLYKNETYAKTFTNGPTSDLQVGDKVTLKVCSPDALNLSAVKGVPVSLPIETMFSIMPFGPFLIGAEIWIWWEFCKQLKLLRRGQAIEGRIANKWIDTGSKGQQYHRCNYEYAVNGTVYCRKMNIGKKTYHTLIVGQPVTVLYDEVKPACSCVYELAYLKACP